MNRLQNIAIVGAGGRLGSFLTQELVVSGRFKVTSIRRPDSNNDVPKGLVGTKSVDYSDKPALVDALRGQDALVITLNFFAGPDSHKLLVDAAIEAGVKYIIPNEWAFAGADSALGKDVGLGPPTVAQRQYLDSATEDKDTHWISITCGPWYEFSLVCSFDCSSAARFGFDHETKTVTFFDNDGKNKIHTTTWSQVARGLHALLSLPIRPEAGSDGPALSQYNNKPIHIASFLISQKDMFDSILRVRGQKAADWTVKHEDTQARFDRASSMVGNADKMKNLEGIVTRMYTRFFWPDGSATFSDKLLNKELGLPEEILDEATGNALRLMDEGSKKLQL